MEYNKFERQDQIIGQQISKKELTKFIQNIFLSVGEKDVKKKEIENFLSLFTYNKHEHTPMENVAPTIYVEEDRDWYDKMSWKVNRPPPPTQAKFHQDFLPDGEQAGSADQQSTAARPKGSQNLNKSTVIQKDNEDEPEQEDPVKLRGTQYVYPKTANCGFRKSASTANLDPDMGKLLEKFENRVFMGSQRSFNIYQKFDVDKDGYVSQKDFVEKVREMAIFSESEIRPVLRYLDPLNKGYVNFREFCDKFRTGVNV